MEREREVDIATKGKAGRRRHIVAIQLTLAVAFLAVLWLGFRGNLAVRDGIPEQLGTLRLVSTITGPQALAQVGGLHGRDVGLVSAYAAEYAGGGERTQVWVGKAESSAAAIELLEKMAEGIKKGNSVFGNLRQMPATNQIVYQVDGPGGWHFFYQKREKVVWITLEARDPLSLLRSTLEEPW